MSRQLVTKFADDMARELDRNDWKGGWENLTVRQCLQRAEQELGELRRAVEQGASFRAIRSEAADVGNFLAMLVWNAYEADKLRVVQGVKGSGAARAGRAP